MRQTGPLPQSSMSVARLMTRGNHSLGVGLAALLAALALSPLAAAWPTPFVLSVKAEQNVIIATLWLPGRIPKYTVQVSTTPAFATVVVNQTAYAPGTDPTVAWRSPSLPWGRYYVRAGLDYTSDWLQAQSTICQLTGCTVTWDGTPMVSWTNTTTVNLIQPRAAPKPKPKRRG